MDVVLLERIEKLGQMGDVIAVRPGYARNFLIPQGKALRASKDNVAQFEAERAEREARNAEKRSRAKKVAEGMEGAQVILIRQASDNLQLYGSVKAHDIADGLIAQGFEADRRSVVLSRPIKTLGLHDVQVMLHPEVIVGITANVARSEDEAVIQYETGRAVGRMAEEEASAPAIEEQVLDQVAETEAEVESLEEGENEEAAEDGESENDENKSG